MVTLWRKTLLYWIDCCWYIYVMYRVLNGEWHGIIIGWWHYLLVAQWFWDIHILITLKTVSREWLFSIQVIHVQTFREGYTNGRGKIKLWMGIEGKPRETITYNTLSHASKSGLVPIISTNHFSDVVHLDVGYFLKKIFKSSKDSKEGPKMFLFIPCRPCNTVTKTGKLLWIWPIGCHRICSRFPAFWLVVFFMVWDKNMYTSSRHYKTHVIVQKEKVK